MATSGLNEQWVEPKKPAYDGKQIELRDSILPVYAGDWKPPFQPRIKMQIIKDSPLTQIVFEAFNPEVPKSSRVISYIKLHNGSLKRLAAIALIAENRATDIPLSFIFREMLGEVKDRDPTAHILCEHCGKELNSPTVMTSAKPAWMR